MKSRLKIIAVFGFLLTGLLASLDAATLRFIVRDADTGQTIAARFALRLNGIPWFPDRVTKNGLRFISHHESKRQIFVATYANGKGQVDVPLPASSEKVELSVTKGFEYQPMRRTLAVGQLEEVQEIELKRWVNLAKEGWLSADAHLHYDRFSPRADPLWFAMMRGDDLASAHFMYLIGGKVPGEWAVQYGYGKPGEANDGERLITAGLEYRDGFQGHINLLGMPDLVPPVMAGRGGSPNYPTLDSVLRKTRKKGGLPVVAHGGSLGGKSTVILDGVLGAPDAIEIGNSHLLSLDNWYRLMNAGFFYPPVAGTDLPNFPERDWWQPFLGGMRMYAQVGDQRGFEAWKSAIKAGQVFVTSGPIIRFKVGGQPIGSTIRLSGPKELWLEGSIESPFGITELELVRNGQMTTFPVRSPGKGTVPKFNRHHDEHDKRFAVTIRRPLKIIESCWLALRGRGIPIAALKRAQLPPTPYHCSDAVAHTGIIRVIVDGKPIGTPAAKADLAGQLVGQREYYSERARYESAAQKEEMLSLFDRAIAKLR
jgi:hypothetical protein